MTMNWNDMVAAMAMMPEKERQTMIKQRLVMFAEMPNVERKNGMQAMMMARETLPPGQRDILKRSMETAAMELPEAQRKLIMRTQDELMSGMGAMAPAGVASGPAPSRKPWWKVW